jgi:hypothetical protein
VSAGALIALVRRTARNFSEADAQRLRDEYEDLADMFWSRCDRSGGEDACWPWLGVRGRMPRSAGGVPWYGSMNIGGVHLSTHRLAIAFSGRFFPADAEGAKRGTFESLHTCDFKPCCNPKHLLVGSHSDNVEHFRSLYGSVPKVRGKYKRPVHYQPPTQPPAAFQPRLYVPANCSE